MQEASSNVFTQTAQVSALPVDELRRYASELGLEFDPEASREELAALVRKRQELLIDLERDSLLDIVMWGRRPVRASAGKEELAREIVLIKKGDYQNLSQRGLFALARLRGLAPGDDESIEVLAERLRDNDGLWKRLSRKRRAIVGKLLSHMFEGSDSAAAEYKFLPEEEGRESERRSLKSDVEAHGVVGGIAQRLRGAADEYIRVKLDEIEARIDAKLDQIDRRLADWRDREVANRLKILRLTLMFTALVAVISLGYNAVKSRIAENEAPASTQTNNSR